MAYLTQAEYSKYISTGVASYQASLSTAEVETVETLLAQAQAFIEAKTGRRFEARTETRLYGASAQVYSDPRLLLLDEDLLSVTTLTNGDGTVIASTAYHLHPLNGLPKFGIRLKSSGSWNFAEDGVVQVAGQWGYTSTPSDLVKRLTARVTKHMQETRAATGKVEVFGDGSRSFEASLPADVRELLKLLSRPVGNH